MPVALAPRSQEAQAAILCSHTVLGSQGEPSITHRHRAPFSAGLGMATCPRVPISTQKHVPSPHGHPCLQGLDAAVWAHHTRQASGSAKGPYIK